MYVCVASEYDSPANASKIKLYMRKHLDEKKVFASKTTPVQYVLHTHSKKGHIAESYVN